MEEGLDGTKNSGFKWLIIILVIVLVAVVLYFVITARFTPSWVLGEQVDKTSLAKEIIETDLYAYPNLEKFIKNMARNSEEPKQGVQVLIRGSNGEGKRLKRFLESSSSTGNSSYPYIVKYQSRYYGLDIIFQFRSPWVL